MPGPPARATTRSAGSPSSAAARRSGAPAWPSSRCAEAQRLTGKEGKLDEIDVEAAPGVSPTELATRLAAALPDNVDVRTGEQTAEKDASDIQEGFSFLTTALLVFAAVAVFVGAFLIFNTFSITVAQRSREFAMLRTLGASGKQVLATVLDRGGAGRPARFGARHRRRLRLRGADQALFEAIGFDASDVRPDARRNTVLIALAVGMGATTVCGAGPAR